MNDNPDTDRPSGESDAQGASSRPEPGTAGSPLPSPGGPGAPTGPGGPGGAGSGSSADDARRRRNIMLIVAAVLAPLVLVIGLIVFLVGGGDSDEVSSATSVSTTSEPLPADSTVPESTTTAPTTSTSTSSTTSTTTTPPTSTTTSTSLATTTVPTTTSPIATTTTVAIPVVTVPPAPATTLWDIIVNSPDLSAFREAVETAGLEDLLDGPDAVTVFVPSNQAFEQFLAGIGNEDLTPDELADVLRHHIVEGSFLSADVLAAATFTPLFGADLVVDIDQSTVDGARLLVIDVEAAGGVIHVVDRVLALA